jgi:hypothetical protein
MFEIGTATDYADLLNKLNTFLMAKGSAFGLSFSSTGNGTLTNYSGGPDSVAETFTVTCTATALDGGTFSVVGSVSGNIGNATVGTPFTSTKINFTINDGAVDFALNDIFTINTAPKWTAMRAVAGSEYIWKGPGNDGTAQVFVGAYTYSSATGDYYNWRLNGFTAFDSGAAFMSQAGAITPQSPHIALWNNAIPYWFVANGRRVIAVAKVSTVFEAAYLGFIEQYPSPNQFPYPLAVGGCMAFSSEPSAGSTSWRWSYTGIEHRAFPMPGTPVSFADNACQLRLRKPDGAWRGLAAQQYGSPNNNLTGNVWPYSNEMYFIRPSMDGSYPLFPVVLNDNSPNVYGRLDGVFATTGYGIGSETEITVGRNKYVVFQNVYRTTYYDYFAVLLD